MPTGVTAAFSTATLSGTAAAASTLTLTAAKTVKTGSFPLLISATGGGVTQTSLLVSSGYCGRQLYLNCECSQCECDSGTIGDGPSVVRLGPRYVQRAAGPSRNGAPSGVTMQAAFTSLAPVFDGIEYRNRTQHDTRNL